MRNQEGKIELQKKTHRKICVRDITVLVARPPSRVISYRFFLSTVSPFPSYMLVEFPLNIHNNVSMVVFSVVMS